MGVSLHELRSVLSATDPKLLARTIVNAPFQYRAEMVLMGIGIIVLLVADKVTGDIHRIALSNTEMAAGTVRISSKKFEDIKIPIGHKENIIARAIDTNEPQMTEDWRYLFAPALSPAQARLNQAGGAIACSYVYPLSFKGNSGALIFSYYKDGSQIADPELEFMKSYSQLVSTHLDTIEGCLETFLHPVQEK
jgi:hypothetical protein